ncbi:MAG TPA: ABC transporter substrate-binding protein [Cyclobacteriaceae bacterium]|nr:ABC transporter substrate-binding protein [Cyclobacteriaceae bacterium]
MSFSRIQWVLGLTIGIVWTGCKPAMQNDNAGDGEARVITGDKNLLTDPDSDSGPINPIRIGLLVSKRPEGNDANLAAWQGAELSINNFNKKGGYKGRPVRLVVRSCDGPWGTGSKQAVNLVYDESVIAVLASTDGRNAHLVEQVITKTRVATVSAWATEVTLTQAFVPWFYRCVPNDLQQAMVLADSIYRNTKDVKVTVLYYSDYDSRNAMQTFNKLIEEKGFRHPEQIEFNPDSISADQVVRKIRRNKAEIVLIFGSSSMPRNYTGDIIGKLKDALIYSNSWGIYDPALIIRIRKGQYPVNFIAPDISSNEAGIKFREDFRNDYGYFPDAPATYAYDGMNILLQSLLISGPDRQKIRDCLATIHYIQGVSGEIRFDEHGNLRDLPRIIR